MEEEIVEIQALGAKGDGIGRLADGRTVFVPGTLAGERARVKAERARDAGVFARLVAIERAAPQRAAAPCAYFGTCGGCALQHMDSQSYSDFKAHRVREALTQAGVTALPEMEGPLVSPPMSRRRAVLSAKCAEDGSVILGFNERASHRLAEIESCMVLRPALTALLPVLRAWLPRVMRAGESYDVALTESQGRTDVLMTVLGSKGKACDPETAAILRDMAKEGGVARLSWQQAQRWKVHVLYSDDSFEVTFGDYNVTPPPGAFLQATVEGEAALTGFVLKALNKKAHVADLYAGCGTFSYALLSRGHKVDAFEGDAPAIDALAQAEKGTGKLKAFKRDLAREPVSFQELKIYDAVVIDPPRLGAQAQIKEIADSPVNKVVSISCSPDSFARDAYLLMQKGFRMNRLLIVDQFLWTPHVELAALFTRC